jgi:hypothetical protein
MGYHVGDVRSLADPALGHFARSWINREKNHENCIIKTKRSEIAGGDAERLPTLRTTARKDRELLAVWLKSHADGSRHTLRAYTSIGQRFISAVETGGTDLRHATIDDVQMHLRSCA